MEKEFVSIFYEKYYSQVFSESKSLSGYAYRKTHKALEQPLQNQTFQNVLEIGAGKGEHLEYVKHPYSKYVMVDLFQEPKGKFNNNPKVQWIQGDVNLIEFPENFFDGILMMCVLHHLDDPYETLERIDKWLKPGGVVSLFLPSDPGVLNRANRKIFVNPKAEAMGFMDYNLVNAIEHKNHVWALRTLIESIFKAYTKNVRYYPIPLPFPNLTLFSIWTLEKKKF